ncbi:hypothetical protein [Arthrobacter sp. OY3WO11]|uniref:hypothetical protein n=1 Tax=Arthrobacter sp. OY3WO11 TaxID=1835723 RepID=UPI000B1D26AF|nr:hypothetical protein [Arthrobacter sp. OY3WO11]
MKKPPRYTSALVLTLISVVVLTVAAILVTRGLMPVGTTAQTPNFTDWVSALGQAVGALGTAGALWLGAYTYRRQANDQRRAQASAVTLVMKEKAGWSTWNGLVRNDSPLPIFDVALVGVDANGNDVAKTRHERPYLPGTVDRGANSYSGSLEKLSLKEASHVCFTDAAGHKWKRSGTGVLEEVRDYRYLADKDTMGE